METTTLKGLHVNVYRHGNYDCTAGGVTSKMDSIVLVDETRDLEAPFKTQPGVPYLLLKRRSFYGTPYIHCIPMVDGKELHPGHSPMFGGNFVYTSDSRFSELVCEYPIPVHDRYEFGSNF